MSLGVFKALIMRGLFFTLFLSLLSVAVSAQEFDDAPPVIRKASVDKVIWAKSVLGQKAPALEVEEWLTPKPDMDGKFVMVEFWATWCSSCRKAFPKMNALQKAFADDLVIIGLSDEPAEKVNSMIYPKIEFSKAIDTRQLMKNELEVTGIPHAIIADPDGIVVWEGYPTMPGHLLDSVVMQNLIDNYKSKK